MEQTFLKLRDLSFPSENSKLVNRMTSAKKLPIFSGDSLSWVRFKQAYELSTKLDDYSDSENIMRFFDALKDDACKATTALFVVGNSAADIIKVLEMRFGNSKLILNKIVTQIKVSRHGKVTYKECIPSGNWIFAGIGESISGT